MTVDASPYNSGISATLFVRRDGKCLLAGLYSVKLKGHQTDWMPCEHEALAIGTGINHFSPYVRENEQSMQIFSDNKACVEAYQKLCKGSFSASSRISTFLSTLNTNNVTLEHLRGKDNIKSNFASRHPQSCIGCKCQICRFVNDLSESVVNSVTVSDVLSGSITMPYLNKSAWKSVQHDCSNLRRTLLISLRAHVLRKKTKNIKDLQ